MKYSSSPFPVAPNPHSPKGVGPGEFPFTVFSRQTPRGNCPQGGDERTNTDEHRCTPMDYGFAVGFIPDRYFQDKSKVYTVKFASRELNLLMRRKLELRVN
ncbi:MAG: hypothetical protein C4323_10010 [Mastigocladus sp. ERB_26_2]